MCRPRSSTKVNYISLGFKEIRTNTKLFNLKLRNTNLTKRDIDCPHSHLALKAHRSGKVENQTGQDFLFFSCEVLRIWLYFPIFKILASLCVHLCVCPCSCQRRKCPVEVVCLRSGCLCSRPRTCVRTPVCGLQRICCCQSLPVCVPASLAGREQRWQIITARERDRGRWEFSGVCLRLGPLLNEQCSILLIMLLWLMSLSADSEERNGTLLLLGLFPFFNWDK